MKMNEYRMGARKTNNLCCAEFVAFYKAIKKKNMEIPPEKIECMTIAKYRFKCKLRWLVHRLGNVIETPGKTIFSSGMFPQESEDHITKATKQLDTRITQIKIISRLKAENVQISGEPYSQKRSTNKTGLKTRQQL